MLNLLTLRAAIVDRWRLVLLVFVVVTVGTTVGVYLRKPVFESQAAVLVNVERLGVSVSRADVRQDVAVLQAVEAVTSQAEVLRSKDLIERTLDTLDPALFRGAPPRNRFVAIVVSGVDWIKRSATDLLRDLRLLPPHSERYGLVKEIENNLTVTTVRQAQVIRIAFSAYSADTARVVLQRLLELYVARAADNTLESEGAGMLVRQATTVRNELDEAEHELFALRSRYAIADFAAEKSAMSERINRLTTVIEGGNELLPAPSSPLPAGAARPAPAGRAMIEVSGSDAVNSGVGAQVVQLRTQLNALRVARIGLLADLSSEHPRVRSMDQQIASVEALLGKEVRAMKDTIAGYQSRLNTLVAVEPQLQRLQRNAAILSESYDVYRKAAEDRRLMREQEARLQIQIIDPPSLPYVPRGPVPALLVGAGALLGLLAGIGLAILLTFLRGRREPGPAEPLQLTAAPPPAAPLAPAEPAIATVS